MAGIDEINTHGIANFSIRRVATACDVSCAAPYRHFKDKNGLIAAIIDYVNEQWAQRQEEILKGCGSSLREQIIEISLGYIRFLMEKPYYRSVLMLKDEELTKTRNDLIYMGYFKDFDPEMVMKALSELEEACRDDSTDIRPLIRKLVRTYRPNTAEV